MSLYPGAAGPVSGWWLPMRICVLVMPVADAPPLEPPPPPLEPPHAAAVMVTAVATAQNAAARDIRVRWDLFIPDLLPDLRWPACARQGSPRPVGGVNPPRGHACL